MNKLKSLIAIMWVGWSAPLFAGHAEENWPEPITTYRTGQVVFDRLEVTRTDNDEDLLVWDMLAWYGGDRNRVYFKSEGENTRDDGEPAELERTELLVSYLIAPFWEIQGGSVPEARRHRVQSVKTIWSSVCLVWRLIGLKWITLSLSTKTVMSLRT